MKIRFLYLLIILVGPLTGCTQPTPMQKLASDNRYDDINNVFWAKEQSGNTALWNDAVTYCKQYSAKPNCAPVMEIFAINNGSKTIPAYGTSGNSLTLPDVKVNQSH